jgi:hypothetical protein
MMVYPVFTPVVSSRTPGDALPEDANGTGQAPDQRTNEEYPRGLR